MLSHADSRDRSSWARIFHEAAFSVLFELCDFVNMRKLIAFCAFAIRLKSCKIPSLLRFEPTVVQRLSFVDPRPTSSLCAFVGLNSAWQIEFNLQQDAARIIDGDAKSIEMETDVWICGCLGEQTQTSTGNWYAIDKHSLDCNSRRCGW